MADRPDRSRPLPHSSAATAERLDSRRDSGVRRHRRAHRRRRPRRRRLHLHGRQCRRAGDPQSDRERSEAVAGRPGSAADRAALERHVAGDALRRPRRTGKLRRLGRRCRPLGSQGQSSRRASMASAGRLFSPSESLCGRHRPAHAARRVAGTNGKKTWRPVSRQSQNEGRARTPARRRRAGGRHPRSARPRHSLDGSTPT